MLIDHFIDQIKNHNNSFVPNVILDIGSRDLEQSLEFNSVFPNADVYAFEPNPDQYNICLKNANQKIKVFNLAISSENSERDFYLTKGNIGASSLLKPLDVPFASNQIIEKITVKSTSLENWIKQNSINKIDIMWMDVQGIELEVLKSLSAEQLSKISYIHCEASEKPYYEKHQLKSDLETFLVENGFSVRFHKPNYHPYGEGDIIAINTKNI